MIAKNFDEGFKIVRDLVTIFQANESRFRKPDYSEQDARNDFINKFWIALGWDVLHDEQRNPYEQEVRVERGVTIDARRKRADYAFFVAPNFRDVRFYVEAKKPSVELDNPDAYFQTIRYGWNSQTPLAVLTDFEQFRILDTRYKPDIASVMQTWIKKYDYTDYADEEKFREIYHLFSRESVAAGSIEKYVEDFLPKPTGAARRTTLFQIRSQSIDAAFLSDLDAYRAQLANAFKRENPNLDSFELTEVTQRTLDRLIFMRFLEDKLIETEALIENLGSRSNSAWQDFKAVSRRLDKTYNGIIFKEHGLLDRADFQIDEAVFAQMRESLAHANSPYDFNAIPIHILGSIYERFLGKVIIATSAGAEVQDKPEVRKAGGVYYTPEYIVRYIVENTVGKLIEGKTPEQVRAMRFADIACGSGSFLIGVYDLLLRHRTSYYNRNKRTRAEGMRAGCLTRDDGTLGLSLLQKREILTNNIYGVDIDAQAVEVAQLSLYLKLLEDETPGSTRAHQQSLGGALLPSLSKNIISGNALIGTDFVSGKLFTIEEDRKYNVMDFESAFPGIMKDGGFDAIVGNPPYIRIQGFPQKQIEYFSQNYRAAKGSYDIYVNFAEKGYKLLRQGGTVGFILPNKFFKTDYGVGLREFIADEKALDRIVDFGASQVFEATTYTCLLFLTKKHKDIYDYAQTEANPESLASIRLQTLKVEDIGRSAWLFANEANQQLSSKLLRNTSRLLDLPAAMSRGSSSGNDDVFMVDSSSGKLEDEILRTPIFATDFSRYTFQPSGEWKIIFPYEVSGESNRLYTERELSENFPKAFKYLESQRTVLEKRKQYAQWYGYSAPRNLVLHNKAQIIVPLLANRGLFAFIPQEQREQFCPMASGGFTITIAESCEMSSTYLLGLLNSKLLFWKLQETSNVFRGGWITCTKQYFGELPIRAINFSDAADKARHDRMVGLVEAMLAAKAQQAQARTDADINRLAHRVADLDRRIDELVYELYELTAEEIAIVEKSA